MTTELESEFNYAKDNGWLETFQQCAKDYDWKTEVLLGIASRETNMRNIVGDGGHGFGCMQIDIRSFPEFCHANSWRDPHAVIEKGTQVLESKRTQIGRGVGKELSIAGSRFVGKSFANQDELNRVAVACYNAGLWPYYCFSRNEAIDRFTTGHNYSSDVLSRSIEFAKLLGV